jgi:uncharacterized membrane protein
MWQGDDMSNSYTSASTAGITGFPLFYILAAFPIACFSCALATDIVYAQTADMTWADFSAWLLAVGIGFGGLAAIVGLVILIANRRVPRQRPIWPIVIGSLLVLVLAFFNNLMHSRDAWTSVVPMGLALSAITVLVMLITSWLGFATVYRHGASIPYAGVRQ